MLAAMYKRVPLSAKRHRWTCLLGHYENKSQETDGLGSDHNNPLINKRKSPKILWISALKGCFGSLVKSLK